MGVRHLRGVPVILPSVRGLMPSLRATMPEGWNCTETAVRIRLATAAADSADGGAGCSNTRSAVLLPCEALTSCDRGGPLEQLHHQQLSLAGHNRRLARPTPERSH